VRRSRVAIYLGSSSRHARSVALVLSLTTGYVSPQFHLKYDDFFETVQETQSLPQSKWQQLARFVTATGAPLKEPTSAKVPSTRTTTAAHPRVVPHEDPFGFDFVDLDDAGNEPTDHDPEIEGLPQLLPREQPAPEEPQDPECHRHPNSTHRSTRQPNPPQRYIETAYAVLDVSDAVKDYETQLLAKDPIAFAASKSDPDTLHFNDVMNANDLAEFKKAMLEEVNARTENDHWEVWEKAKVPPAAKIFCQQSGLRGLQVQGTLEHSRWDAKAWRELLGDILSSSELVLDSPLSNPCCAFQVEDS
jgi:hypothetical protein